MRKKMIANQGKQAKVTTNAKKVVLAEKSKPSLVDYLIDAPSWHGLYLERDKSPMRDVDL